MGKEDAGEKMYMYLEKHEIELSKTIRGVRTVLLYMFCIFLCTGVFGAVIPISSIEDLQKIGKDLAYSLHGEYELTKDIEANITKGWNNGSGFQPIGTEKNPFAGKLDGKGHKIVNLYINRSAEDYIGLLGYMASGGEVKDLGIERCEVVGKEFVGALVGVNFGTIDSSYSIGLLKGTGDVGGVVGFNQGRVNNSYSMGSVRGIGDIGGLVGSNGGIVSNCYSTAMVEGAGGVGGVVGLNVGMVKNSYWDIEASGERNSDGGEGRTIIEMEQQANYVGWDFEKVWKIKEGQTYPFLFWQTSFPEE